MRSLPEDLYSGRGQSRTIRHALGATYFVLLFIAFCLLVLSRLRSEAVLQLETALGELAMPMLEAVDRPAQALRALIARVNRSLELEDEVARLRAENERLQFGTSQMAELERKIAQLERQARVVPDPRTSFVVARAVSPASGPFGRVALLNAGRQHGVRNGYAVIDSDGLVGRIVSTSDHAARLLFITDPASRLPVMVGTAEMRAILIGDNSAYPRLAFLPADGTVRAGDEVVTSGVGGLLPRGLKIGSVSEAGDEARVRPYVDGTTIDYVSILLYDNPVRELIDDAAVIPGRATGALRRLQGTARGN